MSKPTDHDERDDLLLDNIRRTREFFAVIDTELSPALTIGDVEQSPQRLAVRVCVQRQREAIQSMFLNAEHGLGHLSVAHVRPACDELLWMAYLATLDPGDAREIMLVLNLDEISRSLLAQSEYYGRDGMRNLGFPGSFTGFKNAIPNARPLSERIELLSTRLAWPHKRRAPTMAWISEQTAHKKLYDYLYSATSRMLHFSPLEVNRRGWSASLSAGSPISLMDRAYTHQRTAFALHWLPYLLLQTLVTASELDPQIVSQSPQGEGGTQEEEEAFRRWAAIGRPPILTPAELNLRR